MARELQGRLGAGSRLRGSKAATFCANFLALYPALWLFAAIEGVEPTNNHAERILRLGVLWRKNAFGCHSAAGCRFVERMLTVVQTLRLQKRPVLDYLYRAIVAHRSGLPAPQLLGQAWGLNGYESTSDPLNDEELVPNSANGSIPSPLRGPSQNRQVTLLQSREMP